MSRSISEPFAANCDQVAAREPSSPTSIPAQAGAAGPASELGNKSRKDRLRRYTIVFVIVLAGCAVAAYGALQTAIASMGPLPLARASPVVADVSRPGETAGLEDIGTVSPRVIVNPEDVDPLYLKMLLTFEDRRFYSHFGVDPIALGRAALELVSRGKIVTGGSTLTMQVARILENNYRRTPAVKLRQIVRALQLEQTFSKQEILRLYLNIAPFGGHRKGVPAAALSYFGKPPGKLSVGEAALLVALPQAPEARRVDRDAEAARRSRDFVLRVMTDAGVISQAQADIAMQEPIIPLPQKDTGRVISLGK